MGVRLHIPTPHSLVIIPDDAKTTIRARMNPPIHGMPIALLGRCPPFGHYLHSHPRKATMSYAGITIRGCAHLLSTTVAVVSLFAGCSKMADEPAVNLKPPGSQISFRQDVLPIINSYGCPTCHGGIAGLTVSTVAGLLTGGDHGPAIRPGKADSSVLVQKLSATPPFGVRMPRGGPYLPDATVNEIRAWIDQGAKDN
jgi:hypothetical protein